MGPPVVLAHCSQLEITHVAPHQIHVKSGIGGCGCWRRAFGPHVLPHCRAAISHRGKSSAAAQQKSTI